LVRVKVAGPAALLVAKAHKLHDRVRTGRSDRLEDKDAADVLRLMQTTDPTEIGAVFQGLAGNDTAAVVAWNGLSYINTLFGRRGSPAITMASRSLRGAVPEVRVQAICVGYTEALLKAARSL
jgi:hypothetical protein